MRIGHHMQVPEYYDMYRPILEFLADGRPRSLSEIREFLIVNMEITEEQLNVTLKNGRKKFVDRVSWAKTYLKKAGLIKVDESKMTAITPEGKRILASSEKIDDGFLRRYESYLEFKNKDTKYQKIYTQPSDEAGDCMYEEDYAPRIETVQQWDFILENEMSAKDSIIPILICYLNCPNYECSHDHVQKTCNIKDLTFRVARFGKRVIELTGIPHHFREKGNKLGNEVFYNIPFIGKNCDDRYIWSLRPELVEALQRLDLDGSGSVDSSVAIGNIDGATDLQTVEWRYKQRHAVERSRGNTPIKRNYEKLSKIQHDVGNKGEELVFNYEKRRLKDKGLHDLSEKVRWASKEDGDGLGYDILSFDEEGNEVQIEVKATTGHANQLRFFISANEAEKYFKDRRMCIYFVFDILDARPKLHIVDREQFVNDFLVPYQFFVDVDVSEK
jgi:Restriction endonuclease